MESSKIYYGGKVLNEEELKESNIKNKVELEYYSIKRSGKVEEEGTAYGIEVVKKEYKGGGLEIEANQMENISSNGDKINEIINLLKRNTVTPYGLEDTMEELVKRGIAE